MGLTINVSYDSSVANAPAGFTDVVAQVVQYFESHFSDPITVNIGVGYGEVGGSPLGGGDLGESEAFLDSFSYSQIVNALAADARDSADSSAVSSLPASDPTGGGHYWVSTAEARALGLAGPSSHLDGYVGFSSSSGIFDYNNSDGVGAGQYDFFGVVAHEISEVLGRTLLVGTSIGATSNSYDPLDLFHFSAPGVHDFLGTKAGYFSIDGGTTSLDTFNTISSGDYGDWAGSTIDAFNAFSTSGVVLPVSSADLTALDVIGWDLTPSSSVIQGTPGNDTLTGNQADNLMYGGSGDDRLYGGAGNDMLQGNKGNDTVDGGPGNDLVFGGQNEDLLYGGDGNDILLHGNLGNDTIHGGNGDDLIRGGQGNDLIFGDNGNDMIFGDLGADTITGGAGNDTFSFAPGTSPAATPDIITDFDAAGGNDILALGPVANSTNFINTGATAATLGDALALAHANMNGAVIYVVIDVANGFSSATNSVVFWDTNGDGTPDEAIALVNTPLSSVGPDDII